MEAVSPMLAKVSGHSAHRSQVGTCHWCKCVQTSCPITKTTFSPVASIKHTKGQDWNYAQSFLILFFLKGNLNFKFHHFCFLGWDFAWSLFFFFDSLKTALNNSLICLFPHLQGEKPVTKQSHLLLVLPYQVHCVRGAVGEENENLWLLINDRHHFMQTLQPSTKRVIPSTSRKLCQTQ